MREPTLLYEDAHFLAVEKPGGMPAQPDPSGQIDLLTLLAETRPYIGLVHRLDTPTGGVMLYAKKPAVTAQLSALVQDHETFCKEYLAVTACPPAEPEGALADLLFHDKRINKAFVADRPRKGAKEARLTYRTWAALPDGHTLLQVRLYTGRTHQIRVQFASRGCPLVGDGKYGSREKSPALALWSYHLAFFHPVTGQPISVYSRPPLELAPWSLFGTFPPET